MSQINRLQRIQNHLSGIVVKVKATKSSHVTILRLILLTGMRVPVTIQEIVCDRYRKELSWPKWMTNKMTEVYDSGIYSRAVDDDVDSMPDRLLQVRRAERRVHNGHHSTKRLPELSELFQVQNRDIRIARRLAEQNLMPCIIRPTRRIKQQ